MATLGDRERDGAEGTCRGALAKSPIITSKLDSAGGGLSGTGSLQRMKHRRDRSKKNSSGCQIFSLSYPPALFPVPRFLSLCTLFYFLLCSLPSSPFINPPPPTHVLSAPLTPGCLDGKKATLSPFPPPS